MLSLNLAVLTVCCSPIFIDNRVLLIVLHASKITHASGLISYIYFYFKISINISPVKFSDTMYPLFLAPMHMLQRQPIIIVPSFKIGIGHDVEKALHRCE